MLQRRRRSQAANREGDVHFHFQFPCSFDPNEEKTHTNEEKMHTNEKMHPNEEIYSPKK